MERQAEGRRHKRRYSLTRVAAAKCQVLDDLNSETSYSCCSGAWKSEIKQSAGLVSLRAVRTESVLCPRRWLAEAHLSSVFTLCSLCTHLCLKLPFPRHWSYCIRDCPFSFDYLFTDPAFRDMQRYRGLVFQHANLGGKQFSP